MRTISLLLFLSVFCLLSKPIISRSIKYDEIHIDHIMDLHGDTLRIPAGRLICFSPGCSIKNGVVIFQSGNHFVEAKSTQKKCIIIGDNTEVVVDGNISILPNDLNSYNILFLNGSNINVRGSGKIIGDKFVHRGKTGEWGHGIQVSGSGKISIRGITIKNCWGDCIYVRNKNARALIEGCILDNGRRQGISIISASSVIVRNTLIKNVSGKSPQYAIDIEPNTNDTIKKVLIENVQIRDCKGGIVASSRSRNSCVELVEVDNCIVEGHTNYPYYFSTLPKVFIRNCKAGVGRLNITYKDVKSFEHNNNEVVGFEYPVTHKNK